MPEEKKDQLNPVNLVGSIFKFSIATWVNAALLLASLFIVNFIFRDDPKTYGLHDLFLSACTAFMSLCMVGLDNAYIRFYHEPPDGIKDSRQLAAACMLFSIGVLAALSLVVSFVIPRPVSALFFEGDAEQTRLVVFICINAFFLMVTRYFNVTYRMQQNVRMYTIQGILLKFFSNMFYLFGALYSRDLNTLILFDLLGMGGFALIFFLLQRRSMLPDKVEVPRRSLAPLLRYGVALAPTTVIQWVNTLFSRIYVNVAMGGDHLGVFTFLSYMSLALGVIQAGFATFWSAFIFANYKNEQRKIIRVHEYLTFLILSLMAALILFQPLIFKIFGTFAEGAPIFGLMMFAPMLLIVSETTVYGTEIAKKTIYNTLCTALSVAVNVGVSLLTVPRYGMVGAALALALSGLAMFIVRTAIAQHFYKSMARPAKTGLSLALMLALCGVSYAFAARPLIVCGAALALIVFYLVFYRAEFKRCLGIAREILSAER